MKKLLIFLICLSLTGCFLFSNKQSDNKKRLYLSNRYYNSGNFITINDNKLNNLTDETFVLFTYNPYCNLPISCEKIFEEFMKKYKIDFLQIPFSEFKNTKYYNIVNYAPSIIIIKDGDIIAYLDANKDDDLKKYQDVSAFESWIDEYIYFGK